MTFRDTNKTHHLNAGRGEAIKSMFRDATARARNLNEVCGAVCEVVRFVSNNQGRLTFISGIISADGPQLIDRNMAILSDFTDHVRRDSPAPVMAAADVFHRRLLDQHRQHTREEWALFWRTVLANGVGTLIMTPRWEESYGAKDELSFALGNRIKVEYKHHDPELLKILKARGVEYKPNEDAIRAILSACMLRTPQS